MLEEAEHNAQVKAVVLTGNAQCFAAGADLSELAAMDAVTLQLDIRPKLWQKIDAFSKPLISAVNGYALGAGFELVLHSDMVICGENARLALPEITLGMLPGAGGTQRLARLVGQQLTMRWYDRGDDFGKTGRATWHLQSSGADRINRRICSSTCSQNCQTSAFSDSCD